MAAVPSPPGTPGPRLAILDVGRGVAVLAMIVYHFGWDLSANALTDFDAVSDVGWRLFARLIAGTFLFIVGVNLVLAERRGFRAGPFLRRLAVIVAAAALVSLGTFWFYPGAFVYFGILHAIALMSVLALPFLRLPPWLVAGAALAFLVGAPYLADPVFDQPALLWLGLAETPRPSVDYVPVFPWFGVVLAGVVAGRFVAQADGRLARWRPGDPLSRFLAATGRWSLAVYLVHQPVLVGIVFLLAPLIGPNDAALGRRFMAECDPGCAAAGYDGPACDAYCGCVLSGLQGEDDILAKALGKQLTEADRQLWHDLVNLCRIKELPPPVLDGRT